MNREEIIKATAANVFCYIVDHGELITEECCQQMLGDFLKSDRYKYAGIGKQTEPIKA